jgi:hypothetical protein
LNTPIIGRNAAPVASSCSDMLAGLSKNEILSVPPAFCAKPGPALYAAVNKPTTIANARRDPVTGISLPLFFKRERNPAERLPRLARTAPADSEASAEEPAAEKEMSTADNLPQKQQKQRGGRETGACV